MNDENEYPKEVCEKRKLKIYTKAVYRSNKMILIPELRLTGNYSIRNGFERGSVVDVFCKPNEIKIVLRLIVNEESK